MFVYAITIASPNPMFKIGVASNPLDRIATLQTAQPHKLRFVRVLKCHSRMHAFHIESLLHSELGMHRALNGGMQWFKPAAWNRLKNRGKNMHYLAIKKSPGCQEFMKLGMGGDHEKIIEYIESVMHKSCR